jgi:hypothetical protein
MAKRRVTVWSKQYVIDVEREHKTVWYASGDYEGKFISVKRQTEGAAVIAWRRAAEYQGNL